MRSIILLPLCFALAYCGGTPYSFGYTTADGQMRQESGAGGAVQGSYSYTDANGDLRQVNYVADALGFRPQGDISVDRRTAEAAATLAALAPKGTVGPLGLGLGPIAQLPYAQQFAAPISQYKLDVPIAAPFTSYASPALAYKSIGIPAAYNTLAAGPAFSSYSSSINHGYGASLYNTLPAQAIASPLIAQANLLRSYEISTPTHKIYSKI